MASKVITLVIVVVVVHACMSTEVDTGYPDHCKCECASTTTSPPPAISSAEDRLAQDAYQLHGLWKDFSKRFTPHYYSYQIEIKDPLSGEAKSQYESSHADNIAVGSSSKIATDGTRRTIFYKVGEHNGFLAFAANSFGNSSPSDYRSQTPPLSEDSFPKASDFLTQSDSPPLNTDSLGEYGPLAKAAYSTHVLVLKYEKIEPHMYYNYGYELEDQITRATLLSHYESRYGKVAVGSYTSLQPDGRRVTLDYSIVDKIFYVGGLPLN